MKEAVLLDQINANAPTFYPDDTFLVSFPKSGNTWMRFILANILAAGNLEIDFKNALDFIPDDSFSDLNRIARPRLIKSHQAFNVDFPSVIYIVRDPRDAYVSYYHYLLKKLPAGMTFSQFLRLPDLYPCRWHTHVISWLDVPGVKVLVKYEEMLTDCFGVMKRVLAALPHLNVSDASLCSAIEASSFDNMRKAEVEKGRPFRTEQDRKTATPFVRKGIAGDWVNHFTPEDEEFLYNEASDVMEKLEYL